jgi:hypothetical protein
MGWRAKLGVLKLSEVTDDGVFHALGELAAQRARHFVGYDADGRAIFKAKGKPLGPATLNRVQACIGAVFSYAIRERIAP